MRCSVGPLVRWLVRCFVGPVFRLSARWSKGRWFVGALSRRCWFVVSLVRWFVYLLVSWFVDAFMRWPAGRFIFLLVRLLVPGFVVASFGGLMIRRFDVWSVGWLGRLVG